MTSRDVVIPKNSFGPINPLGSTYPKDEKRAICEVAAYGKEFREAYHRLPSHYPRSDDCYHTVHAYRDWINTS